MHIRGDKEEIKKQNKTSTLHLVLPGFLCEDAYKQVSIQGRFQKNIKAMKELENGQIWKFIGEFMFQGIKPKIIDGDSHDKSVTKSPAYMR